MKIIKITTGTLLLSLMPFVASANPAMSLSLDELAELFNKSWTHQDSVKPVKKKQKKTQLKVTATAYTSHRDQTDSTPNIAAWGDRLKPGMKSIAVSRDLLKEYGLKRGSKVKIKGLTGEYVVLDKMNKRWKKRIDIYMGKNKRKAFKWGKRPVTIEWTKE